MPPHASHTPAKILAELQSIRELLDETYFAPPFLPNLINPEAIPLLSEVVELGEAVRKPVPPPPAASSITPEDLTEATNKVVQEVMAEFMPQIEAKLRQRLEALAQKQLQTPSTQQPPQ